jgi:hypothetical protein
MTKTAPLREADLYPAVKAFLQRQGYVVKGEVGAADVVARRGEEPPLIVELKLGFSLALFHQAVDRLALTDLVYVAVLRPAAGGARNIALARRLGLGVLFVRPRDGHVEVMADPGPYAPRKSRRKAEGLTRAFDRLRGDPNAGGATRHGLVTGYRQDAVACARFLAEHGPARGARVAQGSGVPGATRMMADNHYGWFVRVSVGVYALTEAGRRGLADWADSTDA